MAIAVSHQFVSAVADGADTSLVRPSDWNASHSLTGLTTGRLIYGGSATELTDSANLTYSEASGPRLTVGSGSTTNVGVIAGYSGTTTYSGLWPQGSTPGPLNGVSFNTAGKTTVGTSSLAGTPARLDLWNDGQIDLVSNSSLKISQLSTAGRGPYITAGTATTDVQALSATQTWNASGVTFTGWKFTITDTASASGSLAMQILGGASGTTNIFKVDKVGICSIGSTGNTQIDGSANQIQTSNFRSLGDASNLGASTGTGLTLGNGAGIWFSSDSTFYGTKDSGIYRNAAGVVEVNSGTAGTYRDIKARVFKSSGTAYASLPTAAAGDIAYVTDSSTATWGATIAGGGANKVLAFYNGTNWTVAGA